MNCSQCSSVRAELAIAVRDGQSMALELADKNEFIQRLLSEIEELGERYRDMLWQRNVLHDIAMSEERVIRYRRITNE